MPKIHRILKSSVTTTYSSAACISTVKDGWLWETTQSNEQALIAGTDSENITIPAGINAGKLPTQTLGTCFPFKQP